jgi:hypothetical protein
VYGLSGGVWGGNDGQPNKTAETLATLAASAFNKVRMMAYPVGSVGRGGATWLPYEMLNASTNVTDPTRFNLAFWRRLDRTVAALLALGVQADIILFNVYDAAWPTGVACLGGAAPATYDLTVRGLAAVARGLVKRP